MIELVLCFVLGVLTLYILAKWSFQKEKRNNIPEPKGLPFIGLAKKINSDNIHLMFTEFAKEFGELFQVKILGNNIIVLNTESLLRKAFADDVFKSYFNDRANMYYGHHFRCGNKSMGMTSDGAGEGHKIARKEFTKAIHVYGSGLQDLEDNVMTEMELLVKRIDNLNGKEFECIELFRRSLTNIISLILSGDVIDDDDPDVDIMWHHVHGADFFTNSKTNLLMKTFPFLRFIPGKYKTEYDKCKKAHDKILKRYFYDVKETHIPGEKRGLIDHYLDAQSQEEQSKNGVYFTDERIIAQMIEVIDAGIVTTWAFLTNTMLILINYPEYQKTIQQELDRVIGRNRIPKYTDRGNCIFLKAFGMEVLRFATVNPLLVPHFCRKDIEFEGYNVTPNSMVFGNLWYIHHNEEIWGDPWTFRPERFLDKDGNILPIDHIYMRNYLPFSYGQRSCPGSVFAMTRYFLYVATLLQRWNFESPSAQENGCDPRNPDVFDVRFIVRAKPFCVRAVKRE